MTFLFKYKSNRAHRRRSKRAHIKKVQLQAFNLLDHPSCYFDTTVEREDEWDSVKLLTLPGRTLRWNRSAAMSMNADHYRAYYRDCKTDYEFMNRPPEFELEVPKEISWPRRIMDLSEAKEDIARLKFGQWISIDAIEWMAIDANDLWIYMVKRKKKLRYAPGEWMYFTRAELHKIYPAMSIKRQPLVSRNVFLMHVIRGADSRPRELRVYSSTYKPLFKTTMDFLDPDHSPHPYRVGSWWYDTKSSATLYGQDVKEGKVLDQMELHALSLTLPDYEDRKG